MPSDDTAVEELRQRRHELQARGDAVSYVRRVAQGRLDLVIAEQTRRSAAAGALFDAERWGDADGAPLDPIHGDDAFDAAPPEPDELLPQHRADDDADEDDDPDDDERDDEALLGDDVLRDALSRVLADRLVAPSGSHPPRPADDYSDDPLAIELDERCAAGGFGHYQELSDDDLASLRRSLEDFETELSTVRHDLFTELDELTESLIQAYGTAYQAGNPSSDDDEAGGD